MDMIHQHKSWCETFSVWVRSENNYFRQQFALFKYDEFNHRAHSHLLKVYTVVKSFRRRNTKKTVNPFIKGTTLHSDINIRNAQPPKYRTETCYHSQSDDKLLHTQTKTAQSVISPEVIQALLKIWIFVKQHWGWLTFLIMIHFLLDL